MKISLSEGTWDKSTADIVAIAVPSGKTKLNRALGRIEVVTGKGSIKPLLRTNASRAKRHRP